jgi:hypothetical protein
MPRVINRYAIARAAVTRKMVFFRVTPARQRILAEGKLPGRIPLGISNIPRFIHAPSGQVVAIRASTHEQVFRIGPVGIRVEHFAFLQQRTGIKRNLLRRSRTVLLLHKHPIRPSTGMPPRLLTDLRVPPEAVVTQTHAVE